MPEIPLTRVVSVSSADPRHPAENLLRPDDGGRWRGAAAGEKQLSVVLELGDSRPIHSLHIGNDGAAFVEVLGGSSAGGEFQVLLPSAALMSPSESRAGAEPRRVRLFGPESLVKGPSSPGTHLGTPGHTWDRLKVVLSQPYCQSRPYGLSFIRVFAAPAEDEAPPRRRLGPFTLREEGEGSPRRPPGALFYQRPSPTAAPPRDPSPGPSYAAAALRGTGSDHGQPPPKKPKPHLDTPKTTPGTPKSHLETPKISPGTPKTSPGTPKATPGTPKSHLGGSKPHLGGSKPHLGGSKPHLEAPPRPLEGVVLALSGFQNPLRGHLRAAAAALGAQYRPDWSEECTHLVCAFARTPKASRARQRGGVVVTPEWIWECQRTGKRVSCERYLLRGSASSSSEGEGPDEAPPPPRPSPAKVKKGAEPKEPDTPETPPPKAPATPPESPESDGQSDTDPYGGSTEENSEDEEGEGEPIPQLPDFFQDKTFFFHGEFPAGVERRLLRYVVAFGGTLAPYMDDSVTHVVTAQDWDPAFEEALELRPSLTFVRPHWLLQCGERQRPLPAPPFPRA